LHQRTLTRIGNGFNAAGSIVRQRSSIADDLRKYSRGATAFVQ
jgi:hypothetical protein